MSRSVPAGSGGAGCAGRGRRTRRPGLGHAGALGQRRAGQALTPAAATATRAGDQEARRPGPVRRAGAAAGPDPPGAGRRSRPGSAARACSAPGGPSPPVTAAPASPGPASPAASGLASSASRPPSVRVPGAWRAGQRGIVGTRVRYASRGGRAARERRHRRGTTVPPDQLGQRERPRRGADQRGQRVPGGRVRLGQRGRQADQREHRQPGIAVGRAGAWPAPRSPRRTSPAAPGCR